MSESVPPDPPITDDIPSKGGELPKPNNAPAGTSSASYHSPHFFPTSLDLPSGSPFSYPPPLMQHPQASTIQQPLGSVAVSQAPNPVNLPPIQATDGLPPLGQPQQVQGQMTPGSPLTMGIPPPSIGQYYPGMPGSVPNPDGDPLVGDSNRTFTGGRNRKEVKRRTKTGCLTCRKRRIKGRICICNLRSCCVRREAKRELRCEGRANKGSLFPRILVA